MILLKFNAFIFLKLKNLHFGVMFGPKIFKTRFFPKSYLSLYCLYATATLHKKEPQSIKSNFKTLCCCNSIQIIKFHTFHFIPVFPFIRTLSVLSMSFHLPQNMSMCWSLIEFWYRLKGNEYTKTASTTLLWFTFVIGFEKNCAIGVFFCLFVCLLFLLVYFVFCLPHCYYFKEWHLLALGKIYYVDYVDY